LEIDDGEIYAYVDGKLALTATDPAFAPLGVAYAGVVANRAAAQFDHFRVYPLEASVESTSHDPGTKVATIGVGPRGEEVITARDILGRTVASIGPDGIPASTIISYQWRRHQSAFDPQTPHQSLSTSILGTSGAYESFDRGGRHAWYVSDADNGATTTWSMRDGRLEMTSSAGATGAEPDFFCLDLGEPLTGRVSAAISVRTTNSHYGAAFGLALAGSEWTIQNAAPGRAAWAGGGYRRASVCDAQSRTGQRSDRRRCPPRSLRGACAQVQRCQWHKRENVVSYLPVADQSAWRKKLQRAYQEPSYEAAKERLLDLHAELQQGNRTAAASLREGLEETLTLHRLGLFDKLGRNLKTTNGIENLMGQVAQRIDKVKRWHHSPQRNRWMALALLEAESRMRRISGYADLPKLKAALTESIPDQE